MVRYDTPREKKTFIEAASFQVILFTINVRNIGRRPPSLASAFDFDSKVFTRWPPAVCQNAHTGVRLI